MANYKIKLKFIFSHRRKTMNEVGLMNDSLDEDRKKRDRLKEELKRLECAQAELRNAKKSDNGREAKAMWSKYHMQDKKRYIGKSISLFKPSTLGGAWLKVC